MAAVQPRAGVHYLGSAGQFQSWMRRDAGCLDYLGWLRWRTSVTTGTLFDRWRAPFDGVVHGVLDVRRWQGRHVGAEVASGAGIGSYPTASAMLHRLRSMLVRPGVVSG